MVVEGLKAKKKVRILWISRHKPLPAQLDYLKKKLDDFEIVIHDKPLATAQDAIKLAEKHGADFIVPVLPLSFIMHLVAEAKKKGFVVLRADMENLHNCESQPCPDYNEYTDSILLSRDINTGDIICRHYRFVGFKVLRDIKLIEDPF